MICWRDLLIEGADPPHFHKLSEVEILQRQRRGNFEEELVALGSILLGEVFSYKDNYVLYHDPTTGRVWVDLIHPKEDWEDCVREVIQTFTPRRLYLSSTHQLNLDLESFGYLLKRSVKEEDYQISLDEFDEKFRGRGFRKLRGTVEKAKERYKLVISKEFTCAHSYIMAECMKRIEFEDWDHWCFVMLSDYLRKFPSPLLFNAYKGDKLVGFDLVDFTDTVMVVPYGFYLPHKYVADFLMYAEIIYAKQNKYKWLDVGWGCDPGVVSFKRKWKAFPRFELFIYEFLKVGSGVAGIRTQDHWLPKPAFSQAELRPLKVK